MATTSPKKPIQRTRKPLGGGAHTNSTSAPASKIDMRQNIKIVAVRLLTLHGFNGISFRDIATELGDRKRQKQYRKAIWLALDNLRSLQYDHGVVTNFDHPMKAVGALRFRHNDESIRLDGVVFGAEVFERAAIMIQHGRL